MERKRFAILGAYMLVWSNKKKRNKVYNPSRVIGYKACRQKKNVQVKSSEAKRISRHTASEQAQRGSSKEPRAGHRVSQAPSIPGEYREHHLVYRTEGSTELVVLFVIVVDIHSVPNGINLHRRNPTRFLLLHPIIAFEAFSGLSLTMLMLGPLVSPREEKILRTNPTHYCCFPRPDVIQLKCTSSVLSYRQRQLRSQIHVLRDTPSTHPPRLSESTF